MNLVVEISKIMTEEFENKVSDDKHDHRKGSLAEDKEDFNPD